MTLITNKNIEKNKGELLDPNQYVASWTPHNGFGDVFVNRDVTVSKLNEVAFKEGQTRNIILQDTIGAVPVKYINGSYYNIGAIKEDRKNRKQEAINNLIKYMLSLGFHQDDEDANAGLNTYCYGNANGYGATMRIRVSSNGECTIRLEDTKSTQHLYTWITIKPDRKDISGKALFDSLIKALRKEAIEKSLLYTVPSTNHFLFES